MVAMATRGRLKVVKKCHLASKFDLSQDFKVPRAWQYSVKMREAVRVVKTCIQHAFQATSAFLEPQFFSKMRGAACPLQTPWQRGAHPPSGTPWDNILVGGARRKTLNFFKQQILKWNIPYKPYFIFLFIYLFFFWYFSVCVTCHALLFHLILAFTSAD